MDSKSGGGRQALSSGETQFLSTCNTVGMTGLLILRRLKHFGVVSTTSEEDLARHCGKSLATVKRCLTKMRDACLLKIESRRRDQKGNWLVNRYTIQPLALQYLQHFQPQLTSDSQVPKQIEKKTCGQEVSYGEEVEVRIINGLPYEFVKVNKKMFESSSCSAPTRLRSFGDRGEQKVLDNIRLSL